MTQAIEFLFDYISPYAYLAWTQIAELGRRHDRDVEPIPVLLAGLLNANGQLGPAEITNKRIYVFKDSMRSAKVLGVPFVCPATHPFNPLLSLRVTCAVTMPEDRTRLIDHLFHAAWGSGAGIETVPQVSAVLSEIGLDVDGVIARASSPEIKQQLRDNTDRAVAAGTFGVPTMLVDGELFWGYDSFPHLERYLAGEQSLDGSQIERWKNIRASAGRRRDRR